MEKELKKLIIEQLLAEFSRKQWNEANCEDIDVIDSEELEDLLDEYDKLKKQAEELL